jgi:hypothetical protein
MFSQMISSSGAELVEELSNARETLNKVSLSTGI